MTTIETSKLLSKFILLGALLAFSVSARATDPTVRTEVIDVDGQVTATQWRSSATWIWSQNHLLLQTAIEVPSHIATSLPEALQTLLRGPNYKGPFKLQDDHLLLLIELKGPVEIFKLDGHQSMRVTADFDHTNWMRNSNCREANVWLNEVEDFDVDHDGKNPDAFFISLFCKTSDAGTWIEVESSDEVSLSFEPREHTRVRSLQNATEFWLPASVSSAKILSDVIVVGANGEATSRYELNVTSPARQTANPRIDMSEYEPIPVLVDAQPIAPKSARSERPLFGIQGQVIEAHGSLGGSRTGQASAEIAITSRVETDLGGQLGADRFLDIDLALPIRRLGAGLDSVGAGSHFSYLNVGHEWKHLAPAWSLTAGAEVSVMDVHSPDRSTTLSLSPSAVAHYGRFYSVTVAPFDFISSLTVARARAELPITADQKNRVIFEAMLGRTWIQPQANSWNVNGVSVGFAGEF